MTLDVWSFAYAPNVSVFPARSGFTPGWVYVYVGGGTHSSQSIPPHMEITLRSKARM